jgi:hypothetical protein
MAVGNDRANLNKVRIHNRNETTKHFVAKALMSKIIFGKGFDFYTEMSFTKYRGEVQDRCADVVMIDRGDRIIIEMESVVNKEKNAKIVDFYDCRIDVKDVVIVDLNTLSENIHEMEEQLKKLLF